MQKFYLRIPLALLFFLLSFLTSTRLQAQITISPWKMNLDGGPQFIPPLPFHGAPAAYAYATIPAINDPNWVNAPLDGSGNVAFSVPSAIPSTKPGGGSSCLNAVDFTFFQTLVTIPPLTAINTFNVSFTQVDDGARAYIFNSAHPTGAFVPGADIVYPGSLVTANLASLAVAGEVNRVVIAQFDDCPTGNNVRGVQIIVNGTPIPVAASITCPSNITANNTIGQCGTNVTFPPATADGNPTPTISYSHMSGSFFPVGTTTVIVTATNATSTASCSFTVTVKDAEKPVITCAGPVTVNNTTGLCSGVATLTSPVVTDNCSSFSNPVEMVTNGDFSAGSASWNACGNAVETNPETNYGGSNPLNRTAEIDHQPVSLCQSISGFIIGKSYTLTFLASRRTPAPASVGAIVTIDGGAFNTTVTRTNSPFGFTAEAFTFTATQTTHQLTLVPSAGWTGTYGLIVDDISIKAANGTITNNAPATFPLGNTIVTWTATDASGNSASCDQTVTVVDNTAPTLNNVPADATVECDAVPSGSGPVTASDNCSATLNYYTTPTIKTKLIHNWKADGDFTDAVSGANGTPSGTVAFGPGIIGSNSFAFDGTNAVIATGSAGSVSGTGDFSVGAWVKTTSTTSMVVIGQRMSGTIDGEYLLKIGGNHNNGILQPGKVYFLAVGSGSPVVDLFSSATVNDGKWHQIVAERNGNNIRIYVDGNLDASGSTVVNVSFNTAIYTSIGKDIRDNNSFFNGLIDDIKVWSTPDCPSNYEFDRVWTAQDLSGNQSAAIQHVTVRDTKAPVLTCPQKISVNNTTGQCGANVTYTAIATDNCSNATIEYSIAPGSFFPVGSTQVTVTAKDECGNVSTCDFAVSVVDNEKPKANCKNATVTLINGAASITAADVNNGSTDNCGIKSISVAPSTFTCNNIGANTVTLTVTDIHGNSNTCQTTVNVVGEVPTCSIASVPTNSTYTGGNPNNLYLGYGAQSTTLQVTNPVSGAPYTYSWSPTTGLNLTNPGAPVFTPTTAGVYTFIVTTTNKYGCTTTCSITICVLDIRVPGTDGKKVYVCHTPPGNPGNAQTLSISVNAVSTHIYSPGHGDHLGTCDQTPCGNTSITSSLNLMGTEAFSLPIESGAFKISASPNPSTRDFNLTIQSRNALPVQVRVMDIHGRQVFKLTNISPNTILHTGQNLPTGTYMVEAVQGAERQVIKLIKMK